MTGVALTDLLGKPVYDSTGVHVGRVREVAVCPGEDPAHVCLVIVRTKQGDKLLNRSAIAALSGGLRAGRPMAAWPPYVGSEGLLLLGRDLLDQQIIDVHGRKNVAAKPVAKPGGG